MKNVSSFLLLFLLFTNPVLARFQMFFNSDNFSKMFGNAQVMNSKGAKNALHFPFSTVAKAFCFDLFFYCPKQNSKAFTTS